MNKTANIQASFSLPDVLVEDKIERMGNNQMKITIPKNRSMAKDSAPIVYAVRIVYNLVSAEVVLVSFKITKRTMRPDMGYIRCCHTLVLF